MKLLVRFSHQSSTMILKRAYSQGTIQLQKKNWKENVVYLYQFPRSPVLPNLSPFALKVETFLRANNIQYEAIGSWRMRSNEGRLPFVEINGKQIADSQVILWKLTEHFKTEVGRLSAEQKAMVRAFERMIEGSTYFSLLYFISYKNALNLVNSSVSGLPVPSFLAPYFAKKLAQTARKRLSAEGTLRHPEEVTKEILKRDLQALNQLLGDKKFFMGMRPTTLDFTFFGHLGVAYHLPFDQPARKMLQNEVEFKHLQQLIERIKLHYWQSEWPKKKDV